MLRAALPFLFAALCGCQPATKITTPIGEYSSTRDSIVEGLKVKIDKHADGSELTEIEVTGAHGEASNVVNAQAQMITALDQLIKTLIDAATP